MKGCWITFEGIGGSGKSTLVSNLAQYLKDNQTREVVVTKEPGGTTAGGELRNIVLMKREEKLNPFTELMIFEADRHETCTKIVEPAVERGAIVLSDRGIDGSVAYQGFGRSVSIELIDQLTSIATNGKQPHLTILVDIDPQIGIKRVAERDSKEQDQFDLEKHTFQTRAREGFLFAAKRSPERVCIVRGECSQKEVLEEVIKILKQRSITEING